MKDSNETIKEQQTSPAVGVFLYILMFIIVIFVIIWFYNLSKLNKQYENSGDDLKLRIRKTKLQRNNKTTTQQQKIVFLFNQMK